MAIAAINHRLLLFIFTQTALNSLFFYCLAYIFINIVRSAFLNVTIITKVSYPGNIKMTL